MQQLNLNIGGEYCTASRGVGMEFHWQKKLAQLDAFGLGGRQKPLLRPLQLWPVTIAPAVELQNTPAE